MIGLGRSRTQIAPVEAFSGVLTAAIEEAKKAEAELAAQQEKDKAKTAVDARAHRTKRRERQLSGPIEIQRNTEINQVAEDYGLDVKDPQIRAGLIAAWRAGVAAYRNAVDEIYYGEPVQVPDEWIDQRRASDKKTFAKAREAMNGETNSDSE